jgi:predicted nucleic acid-binding protein
VARGEVELVVTERLLQELETTLARPRLRSHLDQAEISEFPELLRGVAKSVEDPDAGHASPPKDPKDDHLIAAAANSCLRRQCRYMCRAERCES